MEKNDPASFGASSSDGVAPNGPLAIDPQGNLYGTTVNGGPANLGIAYELSRHGAGWIETLVHTFTGTEGGGQPSAGMIFDAAHNLYGTTFNGGAHGYGTVFRLTRVNQNGQIGWKDVTLYSFTNGTDGADPAAPLVFDAHGNLYGSTDGGFPAGCTNSTGCGQVFELSVGSNGLWSIAALYPVPGFLQPNGNLVLDSAGDIFGTAVDNQNFSYGEAYEITP